MLRKQINELLSKGMLNIYLKVTKEMLSKLQFPWLKIYPDIIES